MAAYETADIKNTWMIYGPYKYDCRKMPHTMPNRWRLVVPLTNAHRSHPSTN